MMATWLTIAILTFLSVLSSHTASRAPSTLNFIGGDTGADVANALRIVELASSSITDFQAANESLPFATISYAQTIDGSM
jgi:hypothetical protein